MDASREDVRPAKQPRLDVPSGSDASQHRDAGYDFTDVLIYNVSLTARSAAKCHLSFLFQFSHRNEGLWKGPSWIMIGQH